MRNFCKVIFTALPLVLCSLVSYAQPRTDRHPKEIIALINICKTDTARIKLELELGYYYVMKPGAYQDDMDSAFNVFRPALKQCKVIKSKKLENETLKLMGDAYLEQENFESGKACFMQVIDYDHYTGNIKQEAKDWERYGWCIQYGTLQELQNRKMAFERAITLYKKNA